MCFSARIALSPAGVLTGPGATTTAAMPNGRSSCRSASVYPSSANFVAQYRAANGSAATPPDELMLMTVPACRARMSGSTAFVIRITPKKLIWNSRIASSG